MKWSNEPSLRVWALYVLAMLYDRLLLFNGMKHPLFEENKKPRFGCSGVDVVEMGPANWVGQRKWVERDSSNLHIGILLHPCEIRLPNSNLSEEKIEQALFNWAKHHIDWSMNWTQFTSREFQSSTRVQFQKWLPPFKWDQEPCAWIRSLPLAGGNKVQT